MPFWTAILSGHSLSQPETGKTTGNKAQKAAILCRSRKVRIVGFDFDFYLASTECLLNNTQRYRREEAAIHMFQYSQLAAESKRWRIFRDRIVPRNTGFCDSWRVERTLRASNMDTSKRQHYFCGKSVRSETKTIRTIRFESI